MSTTPDPIPIACVPFALTAAERTRARTLRQLLGAAVLETREVEDGYVFHYRGGDETLLRAAEWIALERRCCPFLSFALHWSGGNAAPTLHVTGPEGTKAFLAAEMPELPVD